MDASTNEESDMITISSQRYIDDSIVEQKQADQDCAVAVSPAFEVDGEMMRAVLDGHHSLAAAVADGVDADFVEYDATEHDAICLLEQGDIDGFLSAVHMGDDYYNVATGHDVW